MPIKLNLSEHESNKRKLREELKQTKENLSVINNTKDELIEAIETKKLELKSKIKKEKTMSVTLGSQILHDMDRAISMVQHRYNCIRSDMKDLISNLENRLKTVDENELALNLLDHKMYEIDCDFQANVQGLKARQQTVLSKAAGQRSKSRTVFKLVELNKDIAESAQLHELQQVSVVEQMVEAKQDYEKTVNFVDDILNILKKNIVNFVSSIEDQKKQFIQVDEEEKGLQGLEESLRYFSSLQIDKSEVKPTNVSEHLVNYFKVFADAIMSKCSAYLM